MALSEELWRRAVAAPVARLATVDADGRPHVVPCCFVVDGDTVYSAVDEKPKTTKRLARLAHVAGHPEAGMVVDHYEEDWTQLWWVRLEGRARLVEGGDQEWERAVGLLVDKYAQYRRQPPTGTVIAIQIDRRSGWSA